MLIHLGIIVFYLCLIPRTQMQLIGMCGGSFNNSFGYFTSPNHPSVYPNYASCYYNINVPSGLIRISISNFSTEICCDFLKIYNGGNLSAPLLMSLSGIVSNTTIESTSNKLTLNFYSDGSIASFGFLAVYTSMAKVDGLWGSWSSWGSCSLTCGGGVQYRTRDCNNPTPINGGNYCTGIPYTIQNCNSTVCGVNGNWGSWSSWSTCSISCGSGTTTRTRVCNNPEPSNGGLNCTENSVETMSCKTDPCPVNGEWGAWSLRNMCSVSCGGGIQQRSRDCNNHSPAYGGNCCVGSTIQSQSCNSNGCPVDGNWTIWSVWGPCNATCGGGFQERTRVCDNPPPIFGGSSCIGMNITQQICNHDNCPVNGEWGEWSLWNACSLSCANGTSSRYRSCNSPAPSYGGMNCSGVSLDFTHCKTDPCPVNGNWEQWSNWTNCSENCGLGIQNRSRDCSNPSPSNGGIFCQGLPLEIQMCNSLNCPDAETTLEVAGQHSDTALAGVAVGCVVSTAVLIFGIQFMIRCIYKGKKETREHNTSPEECYEDLKRKRISGTPNNESFDRLKNVSSGTYDNLPENNYENLQLESIEARVSNIYQNS